MQHDLHDIEKRLPNDVMISIKHCFVLFIFFLKNVLALLHFKFVNKIGSILSSNKKKTKTKRYNNS